jgi:histidinol-phosphate phosphatase family protein
VTDRVAWVVAVRRTAEPPAAVLFDRDGTLCIDVPYNSDPERVVPAPTALTALARLRAARVPTAVVTNQSGIACGLLTRAQVKEVNRRLEGMLGPLGPFVVCPHSPADGCACRKPAPGLLRVAAARLGVPVRRCAMVGDTGADMEAAAAVGAAAVLVPTRATRPEEIRAAPNVAPTLAAAVEFLLPARRGASRTSPEAGRWR